MKRRSAFKFNWQLIIPGIRQISRIFFEDGTKFYLSLASLSYVFLMVSTCNKVWTVFFHFTVNMYIYDHLVYSQLLQYKQTLRSCEILKVVCLCMMEYKQCSSKQTTVKIADKTNAQTTSAHSPPVFVRLQ